MSGETECLGYSSLTFGNSTGLYALCKSLMIVSFQEKVPKTTMVPEMLPVIKTCIPIIKSEFKDFIIAGIKLENPKQWSYYINFNNKELDRFSIGKSILWAMEQITKNAGDDEDEDEEDDIDALLN